MYDISSLYPGCVFFICSSEWACALSIAFIWIFGSLFQLTRLEKEHRIEGEPHFRAWNWMNDSFHSWEAWYEWFCEYERERERKKNTQYDNNMHNGDIEIYDFRIIRLWLVIQAHTKLNRQHTPIKSCSQTTHTFYMCLINSSYLVCPAIFGFYSTIVCLRARRIAIKIAIKAKIWTNTTVVCKGTMLTLPK